MRWPLGALSRLDDADRAFACPWRHLGDWETYQGRDFNVAAAASYGRAVMRHNAHPPISLKLKGHRPPGHHAGYRLRAMSRRCRPGVC
jgi:hypothetical protein